MIGIRDDADNRLAMGGNGLTLNDPADADKLDTFEVNTIAYQDALDTTTDADPTTDGVELGAVRKTMYVVHISGVIHAPSIAKLFDKRRLLAAAYDPATAYRSLASTAGIFAFDFSTPTTDLTNFPTGFAPSRYYVRPQRVVMPPVSIYTGRACFFELFLIIADPRRYRQTTSSRTGSGVATNIGDYATWPTMTITMAGAGSAAHTLTRTDAYGNVKSLVFSLTALIATSVVTVDFKNHHIYVDGVLNDSRYVSGDWWDLSAGANTISVVNTANATDVLSWRPAWSY